jgi:hypothetical protein
MSLEFRTKAKRHINLRTLLLLFIILIALLFWLKYIAGLLLVIVFFPITLFTVRYSKFVPHVTIESNTGMTLFFGYIFGPIFALIYGPLVGWTCYIYNSVVTPASLSHSAIAGIAGFVCGILKVAFGLSFTHAFTIAMIIRTLIAFPWMLQFADPFEVTSHQLSQLISNLILYLPILSLLESLVAPLL